MAVLWTPAALQRLLYPGLTVHTNQLMLTYPRQVFVGKREFVIRQWRHFRR